MRKLAAVGLLMATAAWAGEGFLGRIYVSDAGTVNNATTGYLSAGCALQGSPLGPGACDQAFRIPTNAKLTIQCDEAAIVTANRAGTDAGVGLALTAAQMFPTSTGASVSIRLIPDGGAYVGGVVSIAPAVGAASARCRVYQREGTE